MTNVLKIEKSGECGLTVTRSFDAPKQLVWDTMAKPELLKRWLFGPPGWEMTVCEEDTRVGGKFRWEWRGPDGASMAMTGEYIEIDAPNRTVRTECFEMGCGPQMGEQHTTLVLTEQGGKTLLTLSILYPSAEAREGAVASGMEHGMAAGYDRLEAMLAA